MFATSTHLLIGMPKCGCIYATRVLAAAFGENRLSRGTHHAPLCMIPECEYAGLTVVGIVRNPFAWYYSMWAYRHYTAHDTYNEFSEYLQTAPKTLFVPVVKELGPLPPHGIYAGAFTYMHMAYHCRDINRRLDAGKSEVDIIVGYDRLLSVDHLMNTETLSIDMERVFGNAVSGHLDQFRNSISHKPYQEAYTSSMRRQVEDADGWFLERYGYSME